MKLNTILLILLLATSCKKNEIVKQVPRIESPSVLGKWRWTETYPAGNPASYPHIPLTPENTGIEEVLLFEFNNHYSKTQNNIIIESGTFSLGHGSHTFGVTTYVFDSISYYNNLVKINGDFYRISADSSSMTFDGYFAGAIGGESKSYKKE